MWVKMSDEMLIESSNRIVWASLIEIRPISTKEANQILVGVLHSTCTFKGQHQEEFYLALPSINGPISSSDILYRVGQQGFWFLRESGVTDIYLADHPQRFYSGELSQTLQKLLLPSSTIGDNYCNNH